MLANKTIAVVVPTFNEEKQIGKVITTMPDFVDRIIVVNDYSDDKTEKEVIDYINNKKYNKSACSIHPVTPQPPTIDYNYADYVVQKNNIEEIKYFTPTEVYYPDKVNNRIILINHQKNAGVGAAIASGYKWAKDHGIDCTAVMAGDGQMAPNELSEICMPVINGEVDYVKGNRLIHGSSWLVIPKIRYLGNAVLTIFTKMASGYWHVSDTQSGYTAISKSTLNSIRLYKIYKSYGMPNDLLVKLNIAFCTIREVKIKPVYNIGEKSKMKVVKVIPTVSFLLLKLFFQRLWIKYLFRDFHPLFLLYHLGFILFFSLIPFAIKIIRIILAGQEANPLTILAFFFLFISSFQSFLFAMWMDIQDNDRLYK